MPELNLVINGDCSGATTAINNTRAATESLRGQSVSIPVTVAGSVSARNELSRVGSARDAASGNVTLGMDTAGLDAGRDSLSGLRSEARAAARDFDAVSGSRAFGLQDDGSVRQLAGDLRGLGSGLGDTEASFGRIGTSAERSLGRADVGAARAGESADSLAVSSRGVTAELGSFSGASAEAARTGSLMADSSARVQASVRGTALAVRDSGDEFRAMANAMSGSGGDSVSGAARDVTGSLDSASRAARRAALSGTGGGPPLGPGDGGDGGGGGGGGGIPRLPGGGLGGPLSGGGDPTESILGGVGEAGGLIAQNAMIGFAATAVTAAVGAGAVVETVQHLPGAMSAATLATNQFGKALTNTVAGSAVAKGEFAALGQSLGGLGAEVGRVGLQNMNAVIGGAAQLTGSATSALRNLEPAIGPAITGMVALGDSVLRGISSPQAVAGIEGVGKALSSATNEAGITNAISGLVTIGTLGATAAADIAGAVDAGDSPAAEPSLMGAVTGAMMGSKAGLGGAVVGAILGGGGMGIAADEQSKGQDATPGLVGGGLGAIIGGSLFGPRGALLGGGAGELAGHAYAQADPGGKMLSTGLDALGALGSTTGTVLGDVANVPTDIGQGLRSGNWSGLNRDSAEFQRQSANLSRTWARATTRGGADQPDSAQQALDTARQTQPYGLDRDPTTNALTVSAGPGGGGGVYAGGPGATQQQPTPNIPAPWPGGVNPAGPLRPTDSPLRVPGGGGSGAGTGVQGQGSTTISPQRATALGLTPAAVQQLSGALPAANQQLSQMGQTSTSASTGLSRVTPPTNNLSTSMGQLQTSSAQVAQPLAQVTQHATTAASSVTQLSQNSAAAMEPLKQIAPTASAGLSQASSAIQASSQSLGASVPAAMAQGIDQNQGQACDAANQMGKSAVNCGAAALNAASPSKEFVALGVGIPQGLAIGVTSAAGIATGAVSSAMTGVVSAGASGLAAASPSKTFAALGQQMGRDAVGGVVKGVTDAQGSGQQQLNGTLSALTGANLPQQRQADIQRQATAQGQDQQTPAQREDAAIRAGLAGRGWGQGTQDTVAGQIEARGRNLNAANARGDAAQLDAMRRAGFQGLAPTGTGDGQSPLSPLQQFGQRETDLHNSAQADALARLRGNPIPSQQRGVDAQNAQNQALGAGNVNAPIPATAQLLPNVQQQAQQQGQQMSQNFAQGLQQGTPDAANAAGNMGSQSIDSLKKHAGSNSPSVYANAVGLDVGAGFSNGLGSSLSAASDAIEPIASNSGLMVGYVWGRSVISGADAVVKSADFATAAVTGVGSQLAETVLGQLGMLGPAGSGGQIYKTPAVTMSGATPVQVQVTNQVLLDGTVLDTKINTHVDSALSSLLTAISMQ